MMGKMVECEKCYGGYIHSTCGECGQEVEEECLTCNGSGEVEVEEEDSGETPTAEEVIEE